MKKTRLDGVYGGRDLFTKNLTPGKTVYTERLKRENGVEYRSWDQKKSKLAAGILKGLSQIGIRPGSVVLYLGAASGTTSSHVSDIVGKDGFVFALDFAPRVMRDLIFVCQDRKNMAPIYADANKPEQYDDLVSGVDIIFQDIAQKNQTEIFLKNCKEFLKKGGFGLLAIKARSIDITKKPKEIYKIVRKQLEQKITVVDYKELDPFEKDHCMFVVKK